MKFVLLVVLSRLLDLVSGYLVCETVFCIGLNGFPVDLHATSFCCLPSYTGNIQLLSCQYSTGCSLTALAASLLHLSSATIQLMRMIYPYRLHLRLKHIQVTHQCWPNVIRFEADPHIDLIYHEAFHGASFIHAYCSPAMLIHLWNWLANDWFHVLEIGPVLNL